MANITRRADAGENVLGKAAAFKVSASEMCGQLVDSCVQSYGGGSYLAECDAERFFRDARIHRIYEERLRTCNSRSQSLCCANFAA